MKEDIIIPGTDISIYDDVRFREYIKTMNMDADYVTEYFIFAREYTGTFNMPLETYVTCRSWPNESGLPPYRRTVLEWFEFVNSAFYNAGAGIINDVFKFQLDRFKLVTRGLHIDDCETWLKGKEWLRSCLDRPYDIKLPRGNLLAERNHLLTSEAIIALGELTDEQRIAVTTNVFTPEMELRYQGEPNDRICIDVKDLNWELFRNYNKLKELAENGSSDNAIIAYADYKKIVSTQIDLDLMQYLVPNLCKDIGLSSIETIISRLLGVDVVNPHSKKFNDFATKTITSTMSLADRVIDFKLQEYQDLLEAEGKEQISGEEFTTIGNALDTVFCRVYSPTHPWIRVMDWVFNMSAKTFEAFVKDRFINHRALGGAVNKYVHRLDEVTPTDIHSLKDGIHTVFERIDAKSKKDLTNLSKEPLVDKEHLPVWVERLPESIKILNTEYDLGVEGNELRHCSLTYTNRVKARDTIVLSLRTECGKRTTISLEDRNTGKLAIRQHLGYKNTKPKKESEVLALKVLSLIS